MKYLIEQADLARASDVPQLVATANRASRSGFYGRAGRFLSALAAGVALLFALPVTDARADFYEDSKDIIEQLVEDDIATQAVPNAAAKIQAVCDYFPATVGALEDKRFAGVPLVLRGEVADAVGYVVFKDITTKSHTVSRGAALSVASASVLMTVSTMSSGANVAPAMAATAPASNSELPNLCTFPSLNAKRRKAENSKQDSPPGPAVKESKATVQMRACAATQAYLSSELGCAVALLARDAVNGSDTLLPGDLRRVEAALLVGAASAADLVAGKDPKLLPKVALDLSQWLAKPSDAGALAALVCTDLSVSTTNPAVPQPVPVPVTPGTPAPVPVTPVTQYQRCTDQVAAAATTLMSTNLGANVTTLESALGLVSVVAQNCVAYDPAAANVCDVVRKVATGSEQVVADIQSKNYGAAAGDIMGTVACIGPDGTHLVGCSDDATTVYRFLQTLAVYSIDSLTSGDVGTPSAADFRAAAVDLIEAYSGAGVRRRLSAQWQWTYVPEFALREAWRPGHIGTGAGSLLAYPSVDLVRARYRASLRRSLYLGIHGSLLDPLGPMTEVATRNSDLGSSPKIGTVFWLGFVVPRVDVEFGVPDLTKNLVVGFGGAVRFFRAQTRRDPGGNPALDRAVYCVLGTECAEGTSSRFNWDNAELSVFVKYVP